MKRNLTKPLNSLESINLIGFDKLFTRDEPASHTPYFLSVLKKRKRNNIGLSGEKIGRDRYSFSYSGRFPAHTDFLRIHASEIKKFADVGAGSFQGAPTTFDVAEALPKASVFAVDIHNPTFGALDPSVRPLLHAISRKPLPSAGSWDAIRLANVTQHMSQSDRRRAVVNIWHSLRDGGYLLGAFSAHKFVLKKVSAPKRGWVEVPLE